MKKEILFFALGIASALGITALAASMEVNPNPFPITVDGAPVEIEGYNLNGSTYFKLRDIGDKLGFFVDFQDDTIVILKSAPDIPGITPQPTQGAGVDAAAALSELRDRLSRKVAAGEMTQAEADAVLEQFGEVQE